MTLTNPAQLASVLRPGHALLVVPPFAWLERPAIGVHILQALARSAGFDVQILYANLLFAASFGERSYNTLSRLQYGMLLGERMFCRAAFGGSPLGRDVHRGLQPKLDALKQFYQRSGRPMRVDLETLLAFESNVPAWVDGLLAQAAHYPVVGCSTSFEQTMASLAILKAAKRSDPNTITILGGANCEGEMAAGLSALEPSLDYVFSGESEQTFVSFLAGLARGERPASRILEGEPCSTLDELPTPDYSDYYTQLRAFLPDSPMLHGGSCYLPYESSRGCWWGQKSHCTFCGLNGHGMAFRQKSPDRVVDELKTLSAAHHTRQITMTDNIMPHSYFRTLVPRLPIELPGLKLMYEQKANLTLPQVMDLVRGGITEIQPGIEALSTGLLRLMAKGTSAAQNIALLRYAQATGMVLQWNLLYGFPGDLISFYVETLELLPLLHHLPPPKRMSPVILDRFSPYHSHPERFGITDLRPLPAYFDVFPEGADVHKLAYHFEGTFPSESIAQPALIYQLSLEVERWRQSYYGQKVAPELRVIRSESGQLALTDTRHVASLPAQTPITEAQAVAILVPQLLRSIDRPAHAWATAHKLVVERDGRCVPLATADPDLLRFFEDRFRASSPTELTVQRRSLPLLSPSDS